MAVLQIGVAVANQAVRARLMTLLTSLQASGRLRARSINGPFAIVPNASPDAALDALSDHFANDDSAMAIVISDMLTETTGTFPHAHPELTSWAKELMDSFRGQPVVTVAVTGDCARIADIDRVLPADCTEVQLLKTLQILFQKLLYLRVPERRPLRKPVVVRELQSEAELLACFRLRHRVYRVMGYIEEDVEQVSSRMEIDWCDTRAIHVGAFEINGASERLVGTARVTCTDLLESEYGDRVRDLASQDRVLRRRMETGVMTMQLPVFQSMRSQRMNDLYADAIVCEKNCGELSRVIVSPDHRGSGLANLLVKFAIYQANRGNVDPLLLECLEIHERIYNAFGFRRIEGVSGRVIGVDKSMIAMELTPVVTTTFLGGAHVAAEKSMLCACHRGECYAADYALFEKPACPLRGKL